MEINELERKFVGWGVLVYDLGYYKPSPDCEPFAVSGSSVYCKKRIFETEVKCDGSCKEDGGKYEGQTRL